MNHIVIDIYYSVSLNNFIFKYFTLAWDTIVEDPIIWIIIIAFYAPLHFMLPVLFLFIVGHETETLRKEMIRSAVIDAAISMIVAFAIAILLVNYDHIALAMVVLILFMIAPFIRIIRNRRSIQGSS